MQRLIYPVQSLLTLLRLHLDLPSPLHLQLSAIPFAFLDRLAIHPRRMFEPTQPISHAAMNYVEPYAAFPALPPAPAQAPAANKDSYGKTLTHFQFPWPREINGIERVVLSAKGDLQRVLSAYFGSPISVLPIFSTPSSSLPGPALASPAQPITQHRTVHLLCASKRVVLATSTVHLLSPRAAHLILDDKYAIGQCYRVMGQNPEFELQEVWVDRASTGEERVTRRYKLSTQEMVCEIEEVFEDRRMFREEGWLYA
ncbi:hypothetical protein CALCODRAFT_121588 [Calocera cornea HHB12733]|uniref:Uncharacterized protein n=1 Tax=Calocera cornea HHB12733 TaxID=1353952 RepID=A0A165CZC3_9BASI|nr:hypothetical protein CALCODRAFT_121588 [Calocera cornea HHB12733]